MTPRALLVPLFCSMLIALSGCNDNPFDRVRDASGGGALGAFGSNKMTIFYNELQTGGGAFEYPGGENQTLAFNYTPNTISARCIRYNWNGQDVAGQHIFAGFDLMHTINLAQYTTTPGRNLAPAGYTKATFYVRGSLATNVDLKVEVADDGNITTPDACITLSANGMDDHCSDNGPDPYSKTGLITTAWQQYTLMIPNSSLSDIKDFLKATFVFNPLYPGYTGFGQGGTVYIDAIFYTQ